MVLGEGGVIGAALFLIFLVVFYFKNLKRGNLATMILMSGFLAANMGEATFFSPSGAGGNFWFVCIIGGCAIDRIRDIPRQEFLLIYRQDVG